MNYKRFDMRQVEEDLGLRSPFVKGQNISVNKCWHFSTDGKKVPGLMFLGDTDFEDGMNRVFILSLKYNIIILAFVLMDTHVHFLLYGELEECTKFMYEFIRRTSLYLSVNHNQHHQLENVKPDWQSVDNDFYLKVVVCYIMKNPPAGGMNFRPCDYPWGSGPLYFRREGYWCSPNISNTTLNQSMSGRRKMEMLKSLEGDFNCIRSYDGMVYPGEYVAVELVERIFKTHKAMSSIMSIRKDDEIEQNGWQISRLSIPIEEMREYKKEMCQSMFGQTTNKGLTPSQRLKMAKALRKKYDSSPKQIARLCGLVYSEVKGAL